jgi:predicted membrane channel-forming protein YqfA (hemolysin III family)
VLIAGFAAGVAILATGVVLGISFPSLASVTSGHTLSLFGFFGQGVGFALKHAVFGIGSGADTNQARYAFSTLNYAQIYAPLKGVWYESWYLKALIELGIVGLALFVTILFKLFKRSLQAHRDTFGDPEARSMSAAFFALFIWTLLFSIKSAGIDEDPLDVYVWLFLGLQWWLGDLRRRGSPSS